MPPQYARTLQLESLSLGYATAVLAARMLLGNVCFLPRLNVGEVRRAHAVVLRVVDMMIPAARSLADYMLPEESSFASRIQRTLTGSFPMPVDPAFITSLRTKWTAAEMVQMRRARGLVDTTGQTQKNRDEINALHAADVAKHGLKECALPSCGKREASVGQHKRCFACRSAWYCTAEHGAAHWKEHKPICRATAAAQHAAAGKGAARD